MNAAPLRPHKQNRRRAFPVLLLDPFEIPSREAMIWIAPCEKNTHNAALVFSLSASDSPRRWLTPEEKALVQATVK